MDIQEVINLGKAEYKVPGGKLLVAETTKGENQLVDLKITGDFFMHPEDSIEELESHLRGVSLREGRVESAVNTFFRIHNVEMVGLSPEDIIHVINLSLRENPS
jgi:lipoate-protein ligase A